MSQTLTPTIQPVYPTEPVFPLSVQQYHDMIRIGVLTDDDPVELIEGVLVFHTPKNPPHRVTNRKLITLMDRLLPQGWHYQPQDSITLTNGEPEPDGAIVRGTIEDYAARHPGPTDLAIVIEVSDTTLARDRGMKLRSYARAGIPIYWIVNLEARSVEIYEQPDSSGVEPTYAVRKIVGEAEELTVVVYGEQVGILNVRDLLP